MNKNSIYIIIALTIVWVILVESYSFQNIVIGFVVSVVCTYFCNKSLHLDKIASVNLIKLAGFPFYLVWQVYSAGFYVVKLIITGARVDIVEVTTELKSEYLRVLLAHSATLTPGSIALDLDGNRITALWLRGTGSDATDISDAGYAIKGQLENWLIKVDK